MAIWLKQSTASQEVCLGPFVDATDGKTAETGLTIANTDIVLWKMGATSTGTKNSGGGTHMAGGLYSAVFDATDTNTLGGLVAIVNVAGALPVRHEFQVLPANIYDSLIAGSDLLDVSVTQWLGTAAATPTVAGVPEVDITHIAGAAVSTSTAQLGVNAVQAGGTAWGSGAITAASIAADAIGASELAADAATEIANAVWALDATGQQTQGSFGQVLGDSGATAESAWTRAGNIYSRIGVPVGASISADIAGVQADTDNIQTRIPAALVSGRIDASVGAMVANVLTASALAADAVDEIWDEIFEGSLTARQGLRLFLSALVGKLAGAATTTVTIRDNADTKARVTATVDADGNRTAVTLDAT